MTRSLILDTNVVSEILRKNPAVCRRFWQETGHEITVLMSPMVYFEVRRGLLKANAQHLMQKLDEVIAPFLWIETTRGDWEEAAHLWADTQRQGHPVKDDLRLMRRLRQVKKLAPKERKSVLQLIDALVTQKEALHRAQG